MATITVNIHEAKTQLSKLIERASKGETVIIAKAGKPMVKVTAIDAPKKVKRIGFMKGEINVPDDINAYDAEVAKLFGIEE